MGFKPMMFSQSRSEGLHKATKYSTLPQGSANFGIELDQCLLILVQRLGSAIQAGSTGASQSIGMFGGTDCAGCQMAFNNPVCSIYAECNLYYDIPYL